MTGAIGANRCRSVKPPHVAESAFNMECTLDHWHDLKNDEGNTTGHIILGRIRRFQTVSAGSRKMLLTCQKDFLFGEDPMKVLPEKLKAVSRLGGVT